MLRRHLSRAATLSALIIVAQQMSCGEATPDPPAATFANVQAIFTRSCVFSSCHGFSARVGGGLRLAEGESYAALVNVASTEVASRMRVRPGDASGSWLLNKVDNTLTAVAECQRAGNMCGVSMPERDTLLPAAERDLIRRWIVAGAPR